LTPDAEVGPDGSDLLRVELDGGRDGGDEEGAAGGVDRVPLQLLPVLRSAASPRLLNYLSCVRFRLFIYLFILLLSIIIILKMHFWVAVIYISKLTTSSQCILSQF
jgi:hypothetical protein